MDDKQHLRLALRDRRAGRPAADLAAAGAAIASHVELLTAGQGVAAGYASVGTEPPTGPILDALMRLDVRVLLPVIAGEELDWAALGDPGDLTRTPAGLLEPRGPRLGQSALAGCDLVLVPALAVDRQGHRLGRGRGFYDRALARVPGTRAIAVVFADEVLDELPTEEHDRPVGAALTPDGLVNLGPSLNLAPS